MSLGKWFARNDAEWLSAVIRRALGTAPLGQPALSDAQTSSVDNPKRPMVITGAVGFLAIAGLMSLGGAILGIQSMHTGSDGSAVAHFSNTVSRYFAFAVGVVSLALAYGVYRRELLAWRVGLGFIAASWVNVVFEVFCGNGAGVNYFAATIFSILSLAVTIVWLVWWRAQRIHFKN